MQRRNFLTTTAVGLIGNGLTAPTVIGHKRKSWSGRDLSGLVLRDMDLAGADLRGCRMNGTDFTRADLRDARLDQACITSSGQPACRLADLRLPVSARNAGRPDGGDRSRQPPGQPCQRPASRLPGPHGFVVAAGSLTPEAGMISRPFCEFRHRLTTKRHVVMA